MKHTMLLCALFTFFLNLFSANAKAQAINITDSLALVDLYNSTNGINWPYAANWLTMQPVSIWYGIGVNGDRVTDIELQGDNLTGTLPATISNLTSVTSLNFNNNHLSGSIPTAITTMDSLLYLGLSVNNFSGTIPAEIGNLIKLTGLDLGNNALEGAIPRSITTLSNLTHLGLSHNKLKGSISAAIFNNPKLSWIDLSVNKLSGKIPDNIGNAAALTLVYLQLNNLTGSIPPSVGRLTNLNYLSLNNNLLTGTIPNNIGKLTKLYRLYLEHNQLTGSVPGSFKNFAGTNLSYLDISYNMLTQTGNANFPLAHKQSALLVLYYNRFTFDGLEFVAVKSPRTQYTPQANIPIHQNGNTLSVYAGGTLSNNTYQWFKVGAGSITINTDSTFSPAASGMYYVTVKNKVATQLTLHSDTVNFVMTAKKQNNTLIAKATQPATIISHMQVYPNPAKDIIHIQTNGAAIVTLTNSNGKVLLTKSINNSDVINVSKYANGIYYIQNKTTGEREKIVVVH